MNTQILETNIRNEWRIQHRALGATAYKVIGIKRQPGKKNTVFNFGKRVHNAKERFFNGLEVDALINEIAQKNMDGFNILIHPVDPDYRFVLLNCVRIAALAKMTEAVKPSLLLRYDIANTQAIVKVLSETEGLTDEMIRSAALRANQLFGENGFRGIDVPIPMAGTWNHTGKTSFVTTIDSSPGHSTAFSAFARLGTVVAFDKPVHGVAQQAARETPKVPSIRIVRPQRQVVASRAVDQPLPKTSPAPAQLSDMPTHALKKPLISANDVSADQSKVVSVEKSEKALLREINGVKQVRNAQAQAALLNLRPSWKRRTCRTCSPLLAPLKVLA